VLGVLIGVSLDLLMEPVAVRAGLWRWTPPGPWLDVPIGNFVGWGVIVGVYALGAERSGDSESLAAQAVRRIGLGAGAIAALVAVGLAWRSLRAEALFAEGRGFFVFGGVLLGALGLRAVRRAPAEAGTTLAGRLGSRPVRLASTALLLLAATFGLDALLNGERAVAVVAALVVFTYVVMLPDLVPVSLIGAWRRASFKAMSQVTDLVRVLMKPRNGEPWTDADKRFLKAELRAAARWAPALLLFLLPGSFILLPAYAWVLDRRHGRGARPAEAPALAVPRVS
jgi:hypothetical protein